ncbi:hypothetical protein, partial [Peribacillus kribbensis]|uniref:hypothetical protein n=1 Tax=Peribacillus kribbensis TaxID=356658 RepID=UPI00316AEDEB
LGGSTCPKAHQVPTAFPAQGLNLSEGAPGSDCFTRLSHKPVWGCFQPYSKSETKKIFKEERCSMEFSLKALDGAFPVEVTLDQDNGRYMIRKSDTSGEVFNSAEEMIHWIQSNFSEELFCSPKDFRRMIEGLAAYTKE